MRPGILIRALQLLIVLPVFGTLVVAPVSAQVENTPPSLFNRLSADCLGNTTINTTISTGTTNLSIAVQDIGSTTGSIIASGLRFGRSPHVGGTVARAGTKLLMHFDGNFIDSSTFANNGTGAGNLPTACGVPNGFSGLAGDNCYDFDGADDEIQILKTASLNDTTSQITIQAWINPDATPAGGDPIVEFGDGTGIGVHLWHSVGSPGDLFANLVGTSGASNIIQSTGGWINTGVWQLVTITFGGSVAELYFNDVMVASQSLSGVEPLDVGRDVFIGRRPSAANFYDGKIDEVRIIRGGLSADDVAADYFSGTLHISTTGIDGNLVQTNLSNGAGLSVNAVNGVVAVVTATVNNIQFPAAGQNILSWRFQDMTGNTSFTTISMNVTEAPPTAPGALTGSAPGTTDILWTWTTPTKICLAADAASPAIYEVVDENTTVVSGPDADKTNLSFAESGLSVNSARRRRVRAVDAFGNGSFSAETTVYSLAAAPTTLAAGTISTGSAVFTWANAGNPGYTRYEFSISSDNFVNFVSTLAKISDNLTALTLSAANLSPNQTYNIRVRAQNGRNSDTLGTTLTAFDTAAFVTLATGPTSLNGSALGTSSIAWSWAVVPTATSYRLEDDDTGLAIVVQAGTSFNQTSLGPNVTVNAKLRADNASGLGQFGPVLGAITHANPPNSTALVLAGSTTISISWNTGGNPSGTFFQAMISTSTSFSVVTQTISVTGATGSFTNLLPATPYAFRVRAINAGSVPTAFDSTIQTQTTQFVGISSQAIPSSPYTPISGGVGVYHFDESSGTAAADSSGLGNNATLTCNFVNCSTPTFTSGMSGLGNAVKFTGIQDTFCRIPNSASLQTTGDITISAWVNPDTVNQIADAGIVAKGSGTLENYTLEITAGREWLFRVRDNFPTTFTIKSTMTLVAGKWTHVAGVFTGGGTPTLHLYVDGVQTSSAAIGGTGVRFSDNHDLSIGNRQNLSGPYNRGFRGDIDEVQIQNLAASAANILTAYLGAFPVEFTPPAPNGDKRLTIPPDTFGQEAVILVSGQPLTSPILINTQILSDGLSAPPTGQTFVPNSIIEVVANVNGAEFEDNFNSSVTVSIPYTDDNNNGLVDGTEPPLPAINIIMYTLNEAVVRWEPLPTTVDTVNKRVNGLTGHFSIFALFGPTAIQPDVSTVRVYPNPWKPGSGSLFDSVTFNGRTGLAFDNLSESGSIRIFTLSGELVATVAYGAGDIGTAIWDGRNSSGVTVASGVYFAYVKTNTGDIALKKFAIQR